MENKTGKEVLEIGFGRGFDLKEAVSTPAFTISSYFSAKSPLYVTKDNTLIISSEVVSNDLSLLFNQIATAYPNEFNNITFTYSTKQGEEALKIPFDPTNEHNRLIREVFKKTKESINSANSASKLSDGPSSTTSTITGNSLLAFLKYIISMIRRLLGEDKPQVQPEDGFSISGDFTPSISQRLQKSASINGSEITRINELSQEILRLETLKNSGANPSYLDALGIDIQIQKLKVEKYELEKAHYSVEIDAAKADIKELEDVIKNEPKPDKIAQLNITKNNLGLFQQRLKTLEKENAELMQYKSGSQ